MGEHRECPTLNCVCACVLLYLVLFASRFNGNNDDECKIQCDRFDERIETGRSSCNEPLEKEVGREKSRIKTHREKDRMREEQLNRARNTVRTHTFTRFVCWLPFAAAVLPSPPPFTQTPNTYAQAHTHLRTHRSPHSTHTYARVSAHSHSHKIQSISQLRYVLFYSCASASTVSSACCCCC